MNAVRDNEPVEGVTPSPHMLHSKRRLRKRVSSGFRGGRKRGRHRRTPEGGRRRGKRRGRSVAGEAHLVGDDDEARAGFGEVAHDVEHIGGELWV